jgi:acetate kinase
MSASLPILVLNCGSSSIKFALFESADGAIAREALWQGKVEAIGAASTASTYTDSGSARAALALPAEQPYHAALAHILARVRLQPGGQRLAAVAHRVVHGGRDYSQPVLLDAEVLANLRSLIPLAPLHQPFALDAVELLLAAQPDLPQVACFDTAFHHTLPKVEQILPLPYAAWDRGLRRYGFHGLSYEYLSVALDERYGAPAHGKVIAAHLGSGASLCALSGLRSVATSMGFSALDGLMMGTRCGSIDPGALLYLMEHDGLNPAELGQLLYHEAGLLGVSGMSADPAVLAPIAAQTDSAGERARLALDLYVRRIVREIGALTAVLGGLDMLVFSAGIGEHNGALRRSICEALGFAGVVLDHAANDAANGNGSRCISAETSAVMVAVEPTNEEWVAARHAQSLTG